MKIVTLGDYVFYEDVDAIRDWIIENYKEIDIWFEKAYRYNTANGKYYIQFPDHVSDETIMMFKLKFRHE